MNFEFPQAKPKVKRKKRIGPWEIVAVDDDAGRHRLQRMMLMLVSNAD